MGFIEVFNKQAKKEKLEKTALYARMNEHKELLTDNQVELKLKSDLDLFQLEILYQGLYNEWAIRHAWDDFRGEYYDTFNYINYEEKRRMFNNDLAPVLSKLPHFYSEKDKTEIYLPQYNATINDWFTKDYSLVTLKQHAETISKVAISAETPVDNYGLSLYLTDFSSLEKIYEDERHIDLYFDDLKMILIYLKEDGAVINRLFLAMPKADREVTIEDARTLSALFEEYQYHEALDYMHDQQLMNDKVYKKLSKKIKE